ncbi:RHS repeat-associated core domain-containing protein [Comamonas testosteroni]|uniref:RHS repeat-associated core domain-containing protein n=1 Tax=Comamonas testosteroni TaxID=285 RepID=UPI00265EB625|nr:RHS repeat-associated core domain-containing protein [Comamonas testosteroni]WKL15232.1 RHS repeat-associated core domain-containing protein [Comamonas testosteroni]
MVNRKFVQHALAFAVTAVFAAEGALAATRTWTYGYSPAGQLISSQGPRTEMSDASTYVYDAAGNQSQVLNALGQATSLSNFDSFGSPQTVTDPNGIVTTLSYTPRGWLASVSKGGSTTSFTYNATGDITRITQGDGSWLEHTWDNARRLIAIENNLGERTEYVLDALGARTSENVKSRPGTIVRQQQWVYDELGRLLRTIGANSQTSHVAYDANSNVASTTNALGRTSTLAYDALDRLVSVTDPLNGVTATGYDSADNVSQVTDARGLTTSYTHDGFGNRTALASPDTGASAFIHDSAGNVVQFTDARGVVSTRTYDALNRITSKAWPSAPGLATQFSYDDITGGNLGVGYLTGVTDASGSLRYVYDARGNVVGQVRQTALGGANRTEALAYGYDAANRVTSIDYPGGVKIQYSRNSAGQLTGASAQVGSGAPVHLVSGATYLPFGPLNALTWGNGLILSRTFDQDFRLVTHSVGTTLDGTYSYDAEGNITGIASASGTPLSFGYDELDRLISSSDGGEVTGYEYDSVGNRVRKTTTAAGSAPVSVNYSYAIDSNRLTAIDGQVVSSDAAGNLAQDRANRILVHDAQGRLASVSIDGAVVASFIYNGLGQRTHKITPAGTTTYLYDLSGQLLGSTAYGNSGAPSKSEYFVWIGSLPVAVLNVTHDAAGAAGNLETIYLHADHLDTPRHATNGGQAVVWQLPETQAFGDRDAATDPDGDGSHTHIALRFPGQIRDDETGLNYNYFRDYDPETGRYVQSDPIGLLGGTNTFAYVDANPLMFVDPLGLQRGGSPSSPYGRPGYIPSTREINRSGGSIPAGAPTASENGGYPSDRSILQQFTNLPNPTQGLPGHYVGINYPWSMPRLGQVCEKWEGISPPNPRGNICRSNWGGPEMRPMRCVAWKLVEDR